MVYEKDPSPELSFYSILSMVAMVLSITRCSFGCHSNSAYAQRMCVRTHAHMRASPRARVCWSVSIMESVCVRLVPIDAKIFGVNANMVGIKANANVEITNQNILSKNHCIDSCQYIHFQYLRLDCSKETEQWHMVSGEQETSMSGNGTIWALTRWVYGTMLY